MNTVYSDVVFTNSQPDQPTAMKLNLLRDDLSAAIGSIGGYYTDTWRWTTNTTDASVSGNVGINAPSWSAATFLNISEFSASGADKTVQMDKVDAVGNAILVKDAANASNYAEYTFTGAGVDMGTWRQYPVSVVAGKFGGVLPKNNANTTLTVYVQGATGGGGTGTGDMTKAVYDTDNNGKVDTCDSLPWGSVTGKPTTIGDMTKAVYDTNGDGISDHAALADAAPWGGISGKPASFSPSPHAPTHLDNGTDPVPVVTTARTGLAPILSGNPATYLNGTGTYSAVSGSVNPGTWTNLSLGTGWTVPTQAQYRVEVNGAVSTVHFRGMIQAAYSALGTTAFTAPAGAQPSMTRSCVLGGAQNTGTPSDVASYVASVSSAGVCTIYFLGAGPFVWADPSQTQQVYLDGLFYSL